MKRISGRPSKTWRGSNFIGVNQTGLTERMRRSRTKRRGSSADENKSGSELLMCPYDIG